jgi:arylsulfatase A-like enzyme
MPNRADFFALSLLASLSIGCRGVGEEAAPPQELLDVAYVVFAPVTEDELTSPVAIGSEFRAALVASTPAEFRYRLRVPDRALLTFSIGIAETGETSSGMTLPGNRMRFRINVSEEASKGVVYERAIHIARRREWIEQSVDLRRFSGREVWLTFETDFPGAEAGAPLPLVGVFADPVLHDRAAYGRGRAVVVISIDTLRRDHVSVYGYPRRTTPGLEALARDALVFDDAVSTSSWTLPAHASLLTSTYPSVHGAVDMKRGLSPEWPNLASILRDNGFFTQAFVTHTYLSRDYGFGEGFDSHHYMPETRAEEVTNRAISFLRSRGDRDFFLFLHYYDPHWHYDPPSPYDKKFDPTYTGATSGVWWEFKELGEDIEPRDLHHIEALYDGEISYTDRHIERFLQEMKRLNIFGKALVVVTSDHGEEFLDHGEWEHQKTLYEEQIRVPLLVKLPESKRSGERVKRQVSLVDVAPTIVDVLELPPQGSFQGTSLLSTFNESELPEAWAERELTLDGSHLITLRRGAGAMKAIFRRKGQVTSTTLFDLGTDALEGVPLEDPRARERFYKRLEAFVSEAEARREGKRDSPPVELGAEELERLRALGYLR